MKYIEQTKNDLYKRHKGFFDSRDDFDHFIAWIGGMLDDMAQHPDLAEGKMYSDPKFKDFYFKKMRKMIMEKSRKELLVPAEAAPKEFYEWATNNFMKIIKEYFAIRGLIFLSVQGLN